MSQRPLAFAFLSAFLLINSTGQISVHAASMAAGRATWLLAIFLCSLTRNASASVVFPVGTALRLRGGGWPRFEFRFGNIDQEDAAAPAAVEQQPAAAAPQPSLIHHACDYALAGGMDGIRSGVAQGFGSEFASLVSSSLHAGSGIGRFAGQLAFASFLSIIPGRRRAAAVHAPYLSLRNGDSSAMHLPPNK